MGRGEKREVDVEGVGVQATRGLIRVNLMDIFSCSFIYERLGNNLNFYQ